MQLLQCIHNIARQALNVPVGSLDNESLPSATPAIPDRGARILAGTDPSVGVAVRCIPESNSRQLLAHGATSTITVCKISPYLVTRINGKLLESMPNARAQHYLPFPLVLSGHIIPKERLACAVVVLGFFPAAQRYQNAFHAFCTFSGSIDPTIQAHAAQLTPSSLFTSQTVRDPVKPSVQGFRKVRGPQSHTDNARIDLPKPTWQTSKEPTSWLLPPPCCPNTVLTRLMSGTLDIASHVSIYAAASSASDDLRDYYRLTYPTIWEGCVQCAKMGCVQAYSVHASMFPIPHIWAIFGLLPSRFTCHLPAGPIASSNLQYQQPHPNQSELPLSSGSAQAAPVNAAPGGESLRILQLTKTAHCFTGSRLSRPQKRAGQLQAFFKEMCILVGNTLLAIAKSAGSAPCSLPRLIDASIMNA
ncbi:hypothetical protein FIBSPDRAFT_984468 [Athelia psychrophila]|uniref:Uncharacterized protein n=1 Tax=Athelia psychrophila TaxID=1759441 RepID=A0A166BIM8_9AGAM|nr:hypothetical protein FIBSPDRAFT_984468 [Fibularhizoctonia sp. CBS 109695]